MEVSFKYLATKNIVRGATEGLRLEPKPKAEISFSLSFSLSIGVGIRDIRAIKDTAEGVIKDVIEN